MGIVTSQQITRYYDLYRSTEIIFSKDTIRNLNMDPRQIYIKIAGAQWPCIINSTSFQKARIIIGVKGGAYKEISKPDAPQVQLRFCFLQDNNQPLSFFISGKVTNITPYLNSAELAVITLTFTQRPPDDFIELLGYLLDANINFMRRKEERIPINDDTRRLLNITREETIIVIDKVPRHCILRDLSFGGAKIVIMGLAQFLTSKEAVLHINFADSNERVPLNGVIIGAEPVEGRKDIISINIKYNEETVPLIYKLHINTYLSSVRKKMLNAQTQFTASGEIAESSLPENKINSAVAGRTNTANARASEDSQAARMAEMQKAAQLKRAAAIQKAVEMKMKQNPSNILSK